MWTSEDFCITYPMKTIAYLRVSTEEQGASGLGLEAQAASIKAAAARLGLGEVETFTDSGLSGAAAIEKRPGLFSAIGALTKGAVLIVAKRDRLGRDPILVATIERLAARKGARIVSAAGEGTDNDDPSNVLMRRMIDAFGEYERLIIKARTKAALGAKRARGEKTGGAVPFGFVLVEGGKLSADAAEQATISKAAELRAAGLSLAKIAAELNAAGITTKQGAAWSAMQIKRILGRAA